MPPIAPWLISFAILVGNCGFWLFLFNRVNAAGWSRKLTKRLEKLIVAVCFAFPACIVVIEWQPLWLWLNSDHGWPTQTVLANAWGTWCLVSGLVLGCMWLESRRWLVAPSQLVSTDAEYFHLGRELPRGSTADKTTTWFSNLPGNQILDLEVTRKTLELPRRVDGFDGFRLGHLSDLHFTGQFRLEYYHRVIDEFLKHTPDLIVITGDILDYDRFLPWLEPLLGRLQAPYGCSFLLGNHDLRLDDVPAMLACLRELGMVDVGCQDQLIRHRDSELWITANENPWFERHAAELRVESNMPVSNSVLRLGLSHTPDQIAWARRKKMDLLLAGHTHGGQARFPLIGPILAPSIHGSKFASGVFYLPPTLMHVSRGVAGTHPLRWWCPPEATILTLRNPAQ